MWLKMRCRNVSDNWYPPTNKRVALKFQKEVWLFCYDFTLMIIVFQYFILIEM